MRALAAASRLSARLLSSSISAAVAASFGGGAARNSRPDEMTHVFQVPAFGSIRSPASCWASALGISSNAQSPLRRTLASETRFIAFSLVGCHARRIARGCTLRMLVALAKRMSVLIVHACRWHPAQLPPPERDFGMSRLRELFKV